MCNTLHHFPLGGFYNYEMFQALNYAFKQKNAVSVSGGSGKPLQVTVLDGDESRTLKKYTVLMIRTAH